MKDDRPRAPPRHSHLFTVRLWPVELDNGRTEWRGQVQHVLSGKIYYFRDWAALIRFLQIALPQMESPSRDEATAFDSPSAKE